MSIPIAERPLFFLDYDGTLAPIVDDPMQAHPHAAVPDLVRTLDARHPLWIVTGRYLRDVEQLLDGRYAAIGLHGIQRGRLQGQKDFVLSEEARRAIASLRESVPSGLRVEEKGPMFAVHYRGWSDKEAAQASIAEWLGEVPEILDPIWGKDVVELRPRGVSKGTAVREISDRYPGHTPVYIGDDVTDEDAFRALGAAAVTIKVGAGETIARYRLAGPDQVVEYLRMYG